MKNGNAENIVREFEDYIKKSGYIVSRTVHPRISECIKEESDGITVIQLVDLTDSGTEKEYTDPAVDYGRLREQTENVISTCGGENVQVMTLIFAGGHEAALPVMRDDPMCWVIETGIPRLVLDELRNARHRLCGAHRRTDRRIHYMRIDSPDNGCRLRFIPGSSVSRAPSTRTLSSFLLFY